MSHRGLPVNRMSSTRKSSRMSVSPGKASTPQTLGGCLQNVLAKKMLRKPGLLYQLLKTWEPAMKESGWLLQLLTEKILPKYWMKVHRTTRGQILDELIRIDNGRGIIADWLAVVVREENDSFVLWRASKWRPKTGFFPSRLLDVWCDRSFDALSGNNLRERSIRKTALKVIVGAILPSGATHEHEGERTWTEERKAETILKHLAKHVPSGDMDVAEDVAELEILADWEPSPELQGKKILSEIFREWERQMDDATKITASRNISDRGLSQERYLRVIWKGLKKLSPYCADEAGRMVSSMDYWLQRKDLDCLTEKALKGNMAGWEPPEASQREQAAVLWSKYMLSSKGYEHPAVWKVVGKYFSECRSLGDRMAEICRNCLTALDLVAQMPEKSQADVLNAIVCPPWLAEDQQTEWETLWKNLMQSSSGDAARAAIWKAARGLILKKLEKMNADTAAGITGGRLQAIGQWEAESHPSVEMFREVWEQLRQSPWWDVPEVRRMSIKALAACLRSNLAQEKDSSGLAALWLEILREERNPDAIGSLQREQFRIMEVCPGFCPDSVEVWKELAKDENPQIRCKAWEFLISLRETWETETGSFLAERWRDENDPDVLYLMANWKPSPGKPFPPGLVEGWADYFQIFMTDGFQSFLSEKRWGDPNFKKTLRIAARLTETLMTALIEEQFVPDRPSSKLVVLQEFLGKITEATKSFSNQDETQAHLKRLQEKLGVLLQLDGSPEEFLKNSANARGTGLCLANKMEWWDLFRTLKGRDMQFLPINVRHNLGVLVASTLDDLEIGREAKIFVKLCGDGTWTPNRIPAGWEVFCHEFRSFCSRLGAYNRLSDSEEEKILTLIWIGHNVADERCYFLFLQTLCQFLNSANPRFASLIESTVWHEVARVYAMVERSAPDGTKLDEAGQRRWLREFLRHHQQVSGDEEGYEKAVWFLNFLWEELGGGLFSRKTGGERKENRKKVPALDSHESVFVHPHRDGNRFSAASDSPAETKFKQQSGLSLLRH